MTNINNIAGQYDKQAYVTEQVEKTPQVRQDQEAAQGRRNVAEDRVSLSEESRGIGLAKQAALAAESTQVTSYDREARVAELKKEVESGQYQTNPDLAAEKIIGLVIDEVV